MGPVHEDHAVNAAGERLALSYHPPEPDAGEGASPAAVILCHGMEAHRGGKVARVAEALQRRGIGALRFDHGGCGESEGPHAPIDVSRRVADVDAVVAWLARHDPAVRVAGLGGSSMGAAVALIAAVDHGVELWAGIATPVSLWPAVGAAARRFEGRALLLWGDADEVVPPSDSAELVERWGARAERLTFPGGDHRLQPHVPEIARRIAAFFDRDHRR